MADQTHTAEAENSIEQNLTGDGTPAFDAGTTDIGEAAAEALEAAGLEE